MPRMSFWTMTGFFPKARARAWTAWAVSGLVLSPRVISTRGIRSGGFHQCIPQKRAGSAAPWATSVTRRPEVLVVSRASGATRGEISRKKACFTARSSAMFSTTKSAPSKAASSVV